jgi:hypothetical protein
MNTAFRTFVMVETKVQSFAFASTGSRYLVLHLQMNHRLSPCHDSVDASND